MFYLWILAISCFLGGIGTVVLFNEEKRERKEERMRERNEVSKKKPYYIPPERMMELRHYCKQVIDLENEVQEIDSMAKSANIPRGSAKSDPVIYAVNRRTALLTRLTPLYNAENDIHEVICKEQESKGIIAAVYLMLQTHIRTGEGYETQIAKMGYSPVSKSKYFEYYHWFFYFLDKYRN